MISKDGKTFCGFRPSQERNSILIFLLGLLFALKLDAAVPVVSVGVVTDRDGNVSETRLAQIVQELNHLSMPECRFTFPAAKQVDGQGDPQRIAAGLQRLEKDPGVDMVLALGTLAGQIALAEGAPSKPTFAPFMERPGLLGIRQSPEGSGIRHLNYVGGDGTFDEDVGTFLGIVRFNRMALMVDAATLHDFPALPERAAAIAGRHGVTLTVVTPDTREGNLTAALPAGTEAVMIAPLPTLDSDVQKRLARELTARKIPSYSFAQSPGVADGVLAARTDASDLSRRARLTALNMLAVQRGEPAERLPAAFGAPRPLTLNMATARAIGCYPPFRVMDSALLLHPEALDAARPESLSSVAREAVRTNLNVIAGVLGVRAGERTVSEVRSVLFPQISGSLSYTQLNRDNIYVKNGFYAEKSTDGAVALRQMLFSEKALARLAVQQKLQVAHEARQRALELEVVRQATGAYLAILVAGTYRQLQQENLRLLETNLALAQGRVDAGAADRSDVYHWQSQIAMQRQVLLQAGADYEKARELLNRILHRPLSSRFSLQAATLDDPALLVSRPGLRRLITDAKSYDLLGDFFVSEALHIAPDLLDTDAQIAAQQRQALSDRRAYWVPELYLQGEVSHVFDETRNPASGFALEGKTNWQAGVNLSLPLFEGGARKARLERSDLTLRQLRLQRQEQVSALQQRIRGDLHALRASYPAIGLSREAADAAHKSFAMVRDKYAEGTRPISDLLVAQNAALAADLSASNAVYRFLIDLMQLQYDAGSFDFFLTETEREQLASRLQAAVSGGGRHQPTKGVQ